MEGLSVPEFDTGRSAIPKVHNGQTEHVLSRVSVASGAESGSEDDMSVIGFYKRSSSQIT